MYTLFLNMFIKNVPIYTQWPNSHNMPSKNTMFSDERKKLLYICTKAI